MKKVEKIKRALTILKYKIDDDYISRAQLELGSLVMHDWEFEDVGNGCSRLIDKDTPTEKKHNRKVYNRARDLEEIEWKELWEIFKGSKFKDWENYDGTDMRGWWD
jgi:hypothetical protein